jgi:tRNA(Met) cytidine acetyltransferase
MHVAARLREQASRGNQRRLLVVTGEPEPCREYARDALAETDIGPGETTYVGPSEEFHCESLYRHEADQLLGTSREAVVLDCHERCEPNTLGRVVGTVSGDGLFLVLTPPLSEWPDRRDAFDESLAVPPFETAEVGTNFRERLVETLRVHRGITVVDAKTGDREVDGGFEPASRRPKTEPEPPEDAAFPDVVYDACLTVDQRDAVQALERLTDSEQALVVESNRGRGKSSAAGLAAGALAHAGEDVLVTAPTPQSAQALFDRAGEVLAVLSDSVDSAPASETPRLETETGTVRYEPPVDAGELPSSPDVVLVDEAAGIPVRLLDGTLDAPAVAYCTTVHGYEGAGRGFSIRFRDRLAESRHEVTECRLAEPIRYAPADPVEVWSFRALALDASAAADQLVAGATPDSIQHQPISGEQLHEDGQRLREVFGLLVDAHYRTTPNDLARLLDAPNVSVHCLLEDGHVAAVALLAREGGFDADRCRRIHEGERVRGNLIPDVLTSQLRDRTAGEPTGWRVMRIATHEAVRSRGLGSALLERVRERATEQDLDYLGVSYGLTPGLADFWAENRFGTVHLSTTRNARSGEHSAVMLDPLTPTGEHLFEHHTAWFCRRAPAAIRESLADADPDVVAAACRTADGTPKLHLSETEWEHAMGMSDGSAIFETAPRGPQRLAFRHLVDSAASVCSDVERELLVRKAIQGQSWEQVAAATELPSTASCKRRLGTAIGTLAELYREGEQ